MDPSRSCCYSLSPVLWRLLILLSSSSSSGEPRRWRNNLVLDQHHTYSHRGPSRAATAGDAAAVVVTPILTILPLRRRDDSGDAEQQRRRRRHRQVIVSEADAPIDPDTDIDPLYRGLGTHYVDLWVGCSSNNNNNNQQPQRQTVIIDTGSSLTGFPCQPECASCGSGHHLNPPYDPSRSNCFAEIPCGSCELLLTSSSSCAPTAAAPGRCPVVAHYIEDSSWVGYECTDQVYVGNNFDNNENVDDDDDDDDESFTLRFACQTQLRGLFETQRVDGILGLGKGPGALWRQLYHQQESGRRRRRRRRQFSLCYQWHRDVEREAGSLLLGGTNPRLHTTPMVYAHDCCSNSFYFVQLRQLDFRVGGGDSVVASNTTASNQASTTTTIQLPLEQPLSSLVDSGTTYTYLAESLREPFLGAWSQVTAVVFGEGQFLSLAEVEALPTLLFHFQASRSCTENNDDDGAPSVVQVAFPASRYIYRSDVSGVAYFDIRFQDRDTNTLGANFMAGHNVLFDLEHQRIGFAESHCDYSMILHDEDEDYFLQQEDNCTVAVSSLPPSPTVGPSSEEDSSASGALETRSSRTWRLNALLVRSLSLFLLLLS